MSEWTSETAPKGTGGKVKKFKFTYSDIAVLKGVTVYAVRRAVSRGMLDPRDLRSICGYLGRKRGRKKNGRQEAK